MATCLNCTRQALPDDEFCQICLDRVDTIVDNTELAGKEQVDMKTNINPFSSSSQMTGKMRDNIGTVSSQVDEDDDDDSSFWTVLVIIMMALALMLAIFL